VLPVLVNAKEMILFGSLKRGTNPESAEVLATTRQNNSESYANYEVFRHDR